MVFRPGGHGALLRNLNRLDGDVIFLKNIDNCVPDRLKPETVRWKMILAGYLVTLQEAIFRRLRLLAVREAREADLAEIAPELPRGITAQRSAVSKYTWCRRYENKEEGGLTSMRSRLTSGKALADLAKSFGLGNKIRLGRGEELSGGRRRVSALADAFEAILGAAYLDGGVPAVERIFVARAY